MNIKHCNYFEQTEVIEAVFSNKQKNTPIYSHEFEFQVNENPSIGLPLEGQSILFDSKKERINDSASNLLQVLEEISEFREELVAEAQKRIR